MIRNHTVFGKAITDKKDLSILKKMMEYYDKQTVNQALYPEHIPEMKRILSGLFTESQMKRLSTISPVCLIQNIVMHHDKSYLQYNGFSSTVYFLVVESEAKYEYEDSPEHNYLICGNDHRELTANQLYSFNARQYHGVMVDKKLHGFCLFFKKA